MGGLAAHVESRWPALAADYRAACRAGTFTLGGVLPWLDETTGVWIYNLATQQHPGADARLDAIDSSVRAAIDARPSSTTSRRSTSRGSVRASAACGGRTCGRRSTRSSADNDDVDLVVVTKQ